LRRAAPPSEPRIICAANFLLTIRHDGSRRRRIVVATLSWVRCQDAAHVGESVMLYFGNREPPLDEVLDDPIVRLVMARDRLTREEVQAQIEAAQRRRRNCRRSIVGFV